jgi:UDP-N-acetylmuramate dehydrogenase
MGIDVLAHLFVDVSSIDELKSVLIEYKNTPKLILGGGSNMLLTKNFEGIVIKINLLGKQIIKEENNECLVEINAGEVWHELVLWTIENKLGGIENLSLIPGSVGAAPMQNIGAYGVEIKDVFVSLKALNVYTLEEDVFELRECNFGYRESIFKHSHKDKFIILSVIFKLYKNAILHTSYGAIGEELTKLNVTTPTIKDVSNAVIAIRQSKLPNPAVIGNCGSFFKNPVINKILFERLKSLYPTMPSYAIGEEYKIPAGWLIEQCGYKGKVIGNTGSHKDQALVLVNYGNATGNEIFALAKEIKATVLQKFEIEIEMEVNII